MSETVKKHNFLLFQRGPTDTLGEIEFFPKSFFDLNYYPYYGKLRHVSESFSFVDRISTIWIKYEMTSVVSLVSQTNYSAPVVAVRFMSVQYDTHIQVQCKLNGKGIINDSPTDRNLGSVTFSLDIGAWGEDIAASRMLLWRGRKMYKKKICWTIIFHEIYSFPLLIFYLNIHIFCCETNSSRSRCLLLCFCSWASSCHKVSYNSWYFVMISKINQTKWRSAQ